MSERQQPSSARRRLQALRAIPDSRRTDEQWDELNELEIMLAPENRVNAPVPAPRREPNRREPGDGTTRPAPSAAHPSAPPNARRKPVKRPRKRLPDATTTPQ